MWPRKLGSGGSHFLEGHAGTLQPSGQGPGVQPPSTASGLLTLGGVVSAPAVPSASSQPTEGLLFWLPAKPAGRLGTGPTALALSRGFQPSGSAVLGWLGGPWHTGHRKPSPGINVREGESAQGPPLERGLEAWDSAPSGCGKSGHATDPYFTDGKSKAPKRLAWAATSMWRWRGEALGTGQGGPSGWPGGLRDASSAPQWQLPGTQQADASGYVPSELGGVLQSRLSAGVWATSPRSGDNQKDCLPCRRLTASACKPVFLWQWSRSHGGTSADRDGGAGAQRQAFGGAPPSCYPRSW